MFRHQGKNRTFIHNLRLATLLSFVAGIVNITGVLALKTLTTNVTGHFAFFAEEFMKRDFTSAITFLLFIIFFLLGSFTSNFLAELVSRKKPELSHVIPISLEIFVLVGVGILGNQSNISNLDGKLIAFFVPVLHFEFVLVVGVFWQLYSTIVYLYKSTKETNV